MTFIIKPLVTEKMTKMTDKSSVDKTVKHKGEVRTIPAQPKYGFIVKPEANKLQIQQEVEKRYNVKRCRRQHYALLWQASGSLHKERPCERSAQRLQESICHPEEW